MRRHKNLKRLHSENVSAVTQAAPGVPARLFIYVAKVKEISSISEKFKKTTNPLELFENIPYNIDEGKTRYRGRGRKITHRR